MKFCKIPALHALAFISLPLASVQAHEVRNGGNAVVCYSDESRGELRSVELFDYWEGRNFREEKILNLGAPNLSVAEKIDIFLTRVEAHDRVRAVQYRNYAKVLVNFTSEFLVDRLPSEPIDDDTPLGLPEAPCFKEQFAIQIRDPQPGERRFLISRSLYENPLTTNDQRAGILIHEIIYRNAIVHEKHTTSDGTRLMNYALSTMIDPDSETAKIYLASVQAGLPIISRGEVVRILPYNVDIVVDPELGSPSSLREGESAVFYLALSSDIKNSRFSALLHGRFDSRGSLEIYLEKRQGTYVVTHFKGYASGTITFKRLTINGVTQSDARTYYLHEGFSIYEDGSPRQFGVENGEHGYLESDLLRRFRVQKTCPYDYFILDQDGKIVKTKCAKY